jgi:hypothetical protein
MAYGASTAETRLETKGVGENDRTVEGFATLGDLVPGVNG